MPVDVREATHVVVNGETKKIKSLWGVDEKGRLAKPSEGGFGVVTEDGQHVSMWDADFYIKEY